jgi:hypothetical protein
MMESLRLTVEVRHTPRHVFDVVSEPTNDPNQAKVDVVIEGAPVRSLSRLCVSRRRALEIAHDLRELKRLLESRKL